MKVYLVQLRQILTQRFSAEELRTFCFDLGVDYDDLPAAGKANKARELVAYLERHDRIPECLELGKRMRPDIPWERVQLALLEDAQEHAADPRRFQPLIDELRDTLAGWEDRVERQRERIASGLKEQRQKMADERVRRREKERLHVVGQPPLDVVDHFKNRWREQQTIGQLLVEPTTRLVSVVGHGGMGKTALACKVLQDLERHRWPHTDEEIPLDGIVYLSTRTAGISLERLFLDCAKLLGGEGQARINAVWTNPQLDTEEKVTRLLESLSDGRHVILLDNLEDLLDDQGQFTDDDLRLFFDRSLTTTQGAQLMVTSRVALAFRREVIRFDRQVKLLEGLPIGDGVALLRELDPNGDYGLRDAPEEQLAHAVELTHGVPRALEVLAGLLANDPFAGLDEVLETFYEQEDVVQALIEENYRRLDRDARRVIEALAVFRKPVPPLAIDYLLEPFAPGLDVPGTVRRLTRTNIVSVDRAAKTVMLHPIDQDYAYSQLPEEDETDSAYTRRALERRAADYYVQLRTPEGTWKSIEDLEPQLNEFEHRVRAGDHDEACLALKPIDFNYLQRWGHYVRLVEMRERLLAQLMDRGLHATNLLSLGRACRALGQLKRAIQLYKEALATAREAGDFWIEGSALGSLGVAYLDLGRFKRVITFLEQALSTTRDIGDREGESRHLGNLSIAYLQLGQLERCVHLIEDALGIARHIGDSRGEGMRLGDLGRVYRSLGKVEQAIEHCKEALTVTREIGHQLGELLSLADLGAAYHTQGQVKQAIKLYEEALLIARAIGYRRGESYCLVRLGKALLATEELSKAQQSCAQAVALDVPGIAYQAALALGIALLCQHDDTAKEAFTDAVARCRAMLEKTAGLYEPRYALATALVGQAVSDPRWADQNERPDLLAPALDEYRRALEITAAPGVVQDALRDLELIQAAGIDGLEPAFELLEHAEYKPDLPKDLPDILEEIQ